MHRIEKVQDGEGSKNEDDTGLRRSRMEVGRR